MKKRIHRFVSQHSTTLLATTALLLGGSLSLWLSILSPHAFATVSKQFAGTLIRSGSGNKAPQPQQPLVFTSTIILGGDIMLSRQIGAWNKEFGYNRLFSRQPRGTGKKIPTGAPTIGVHPFINLPPCFDGACLMLFNLESPFSKQDRDRHERTFLFAANTGNIAVLEGIRRPRECICAPATHSGSTNTGRLVNNGANTMVVSLANNHITNAGGGGLETTQKLLDEHGIYHVGAHPDKQASRRPLQFVHNDISWCIGAYSYDGGGGTYGGRSLHRNKLDAPSIIDDMSRIKKDQHCDITAVMLHRGAEYAMQPSAQQKTLAHALIDSGIDLIIGAHAHVPGRIERYKEKYIFYSLGNALFDQDRGRTSVSKNMSTITDYSLNKKTVPTYMSIFPRLLATKTASGTILSLEAIHTYEVNKGLFTPADPRTVRDLLSTIQP